MGECYNYDYFVIGAGSGGVRSARIAASHGAKVSIAEGRYFGGTCVNVGCVPKKLLSYAADYGQHMEDAKAYGWCVEREGLTFDWKHFCKNKDEEINRLNSIYINLLENAGVQIHKGFASFVDESTLQIGDDIVKANHILIASGGKPRMPDFKGANHMISSDEAFYLDKLPEHVALYGGGYISMEFAHIFHGLGCKVTIIHRAAEFMRAFDTDIRRHLQHEMEKQGIHLLFNTEITSIEKHGKDYHLHLSDGLMLKCDLPMAAIGRVPETGPLNLEKAGIAVKESGHIAVNDIYQTNHSHIHAIGDIIGRVELTPVAIAEGHWLADTLFGDIDRPCPSYHDIPTAVFSRPNIATVGMTEDEARKEGFDVQIFKSEFKPLVHTLSGRDERTLIKMIVDKKTDKVLGIHMIGMDSAEIMQGFAVAIKAGATKAVFDQTIGIHPTSAEELVTLK